jgi:hypothetical protein
MTAVQAASLDPGANRLFGESERSQLPDGYDYMLSIGELSETCVIWVIVWITRAHHA